jgi:hypothetical protein
MPIGQEQTDELHTHFHILHICEITVMGSEDYCPGMALELKVFCLKLLNIFSQQHFTRAL